MPTSYHMLDQTWTEIATGPLLADIKSGTALIHFGDEVPAEDTLAFHQVSAADAVPRVGYEGTRKMFAKTGPRGCELVVTETA